MKLITLAILMFTAVFISACKDEGGVPSTAQIEYYVPAELRSCPYAPSSPGRSATARQRAAYISGLYFAWKRCHGNLAQRDALYAKYRSRVEAFTSTDN
jgi:hypothetical protein